MWPASIGLLVLATLLFTYAPTSADEDLWGHVRFGEDLWRTHRIARPDVYSYSTSNSRWVNHEWMAEAAFAAAYDRAGAPGLIAVKVVVVLVASLMAFRHLMRHGLHPLSVGLWLLVTGHLMLPGFGKMRPQIFTCLFLVCLLLVLDSAERRKLWRLWLLPPMFALWANLHGGILVGVGTVLLWLAGHIVAHAAGLRSGSAPFNPLQRRVLLPVVLTVTATLATPYGPELWWFLRTALAPRPEIVEWTPLDMTSFGGALYQFLGALTVTGMILGTSPKSPGLVPVFVVLLVLPLFAVRHAPLFGIGALLIAGPHVADTLARHTGWTFEPAARLTSARKWMAACFAACSALLAVGSVPYFGCITIDGPFPLTTVERIKQAGVTGNMVVHFDWGEYVLWHLGPAVKVSIDGRRETLYDDSTYKSNMRFIDGIGDWDSVLRDPSVIMVLVSKRFPSFNLMRLSPGWVLVAQDDASGLFGKDGSQTLERLKTASAGTPLPRNSCFP